MSQHEPIAQTTPAADQGKIFTVAEANRSLVLVARIVQDLVAKYRRFMELRDARHELSLLPGNSLRLEQIGAEAEALRQELARLHEELERIGCVLKDWTDGKVDFPARHRGRPVFLCWRLGDDSVTHWHELHAGFAGRQPVGPDFS